MPSQNVAQIAIITPIALTNKDQGKHSCYTILKIIAYTFMVYS